MKKVYNVLFLLHDSHINGGANRSLFDCVIRLKQNNLINPIVIYPDKNRSINTLLDKENIKYYNFRYNTWFYNKNQAKLKKAKYLLKAFIKHIISYFNYFRIKKIIKENNIQLIYTNTSVVYFGCYLSKKLNIPHIWHIREFGEEDHNITFPFNKSKFYNMIDNNTNKVIVISNALKNKHINNIIDKNKLIVLYNDISKDFINPKDNFNMDYKKQLNIAMIGTISEGKGQIDAIKAIERLREKNIKLYIAGEKNNSSYNLMIEKYVKTHNLEEKVEFAGYIKNINEFRKNMDVGIVASASEAFGRTTIEGMLSEMLIIASSAGSNIELIRNGENGFLYELHNDEQLANIIAQIYMDRNLLKEKAINGFCYAKRFTKGNTANKIYQVIDDILSSDGGV